MSSELSYFNNHLLHELGLKEASYSPSNTARQAIADKVVTIFISPSGVGKTSNIDTLCKLDAQFGEAGSLTSRSPRPDDKAGEYEYVEHSDEGLRTPLNLIARRLAVQYTVHPTLGYLYMGRPDHYTHQHSLVPKMPTSVDQMRRAGFAQLNTIHLVSEPAPWFDRFENRFPVGHPQHMPRLKEAIGSLVWTLEQTGPHDHIVEVVDGKPEVTAQRILDILIGNRSDEHGRGKELALSQIDAAKERLRQLQ